MIRNKIDRDRCMGSGSCQSHAPHVPYNVVVVELEEGPVFHSNLVDCANENIRVGMPVELVFQQSEGGPNLPCFRPRRDA